MSNMHIIRRCIGLVVIRVRVRVEFCVHNLTIVLHYTTKSHCSNNLYSLCARHAVYATGKMQEMAVFLLRAPIPRVKVP